MHKTISTALNAFGYASTITSAAFIVLFTALMTAGITINLFEHNLTVAVSEMFLFGYGLIFTIIKFVKFAGEKA